MKKKSLLLAIAGIMLATANAPTAQAHEVSGIEISQTTVLPIKGIKESTDGIFNLKSFEVEVSEAGDYYTEFWLLPAKLADKSYSSFLIYVNNSYVGTICPSAGNWQSARVEGNETLNLSKGTNVITIATKAPEFPEVETIKVAMNDADATFSSTSYEEYLDAAAEGMTYNVPEEGDILTDAGNATVVQPDHFSNVPLNYTFYKTLSFTQGQDIFITTSSQASHKIDIVFYGTPTTIPVNGGSDVQPQGFTIGGTVTPGDGRPNFKQEIDYTPATSEEMQGLSWVYPSEKALNSSIEVATARVNITKTGLYLIRVRHTVNGGSSLADVNVNGKYYYENVPINLSYERCVIPADDNVYATFTCCNNFGIDDPYLFIHGAKCDKIVGYNDDGPSSKLKQYDLSSLDSYISQKYKMKTTGISVSNYSSLNPKSRCSIFARMQEGNVRSVSKSRAKSENPADVSTPSITDVSVRITGPDNVAGTLSIIANENIQKVSVYGLSGNIVASVNCKESRVDIPASSLNMAEPGIYVISVETLTGMISEKIAVK